MFKKYCFIVYLFFFSGIVLGQFGYDHYYNAQTLNANNIILQLNNYGDLNGQYNQGFWNVTNDCILFDQGFWVVGKIDDFPHAALSYWTNYYSPGPILNGQSAMLSHPEDSLRYRIYKINKGDDNSNPDLAEWPEEWGAPTDESGNPKVFGDQSLWTIYNGFDETLTQRISWNTNTYQDTLPPMPVEIQQLAYSRSGNKSDKDDIFSNVVFFEWTIINKGDKQIDSAYIGLWSDIDFYFAAYNNPAVDIDRNLGYCWYGSDDPHGMTGIPPAVGYTLLYGPVVPSASSSAVFKGKDKESFQNLTASSSHPITDDSNNNPIWGATFTLEGIWNIARGLDANGSVIIDPVTGHDTKFPANGDPVSNTGWLTTATGGGSGFVMFSGPFTMAPGDTQWVMAALVPGLGGDRFSSITAMRDKVDILHSLPYDSLAFGSTANMITGIYGNDNTTPASFNLSQNYPNPFNPVTVISYQLPIVSNITLKIYDVLGREVAALVNEEQKPGTYKVEFDGSKLSSGVYFYKLQTGSGFYMIKKLILLK